VETNDCKRWDAENGGKSSNSEKKMPTIGEASSDCAVSAAFGIGNWKLKEKSPVKKEAARAETVG
jgi:hypothetical protein